MTSIRVTTILLLVLNLNNAISVPRHRISGYSHTRNLKTIKLEDVIPNKFPQYGFNGTWMSKNEFYFYDIERNLNKFNVESKIKTELLGKDVLKQWNATSTKMNKPGTRLLLRYGDRQVFRHSILAKYVVYDLVDKKAINVAKEQELWECIWSPRGDAIAYVKQDNNVYVYNIVTENEQQVTFDGKVEDNSGIIYNGISDWVYEEEVFGSKNGMWFSPDGKYLALVHLDDTFVENFTYPIYGQPGNVDNQYPTGVTLRYPKAGTTNPTVELRVVDTDLFTAMKVYKAPNDISEPILGSVSWINQNTVTPMWLNRRQNEAVYMTCNVQNTGTFCLTLHEKQEKNGWVDAVSLECSKIGNEDFCFYKENIDGWRRLAELNVVSKDVFAKSPVDATVISFKGYDPAKNNLYFISTGINIDQITNPAIRHLYVLNRESNQLKCVSCEITSPENDKCTFVTAVSFSTDFSYFAITCGGPGPSYTKLMKNGDVLSIVDLWEGNFYTRDLLSEYMHTRFMYLRVPVGPNKEYSAMVKLHLPACFDENSSRKYPMLVQVYGGPDSVRVSDSFGMGFPDYMAQSKNVIYCQIDGRGSGNKGTDMLFTVNNKLGTAEIEDQIEVVKYLVNDLGFVDRDRIGIWGWSYGGYATGMVLTHDKDKVFKGGVSVAPVSSWIYYDTIYTERYMGTPKENPEGYEKSDLTKYAKNLAGHEYLLIHGNADDNVHYQQAMAWARELELNDILFEQQSYPDEAHGLTGVQKHLYHTMDEFWVKTLKLTEADEKCQQARSYWNWFK
uniref:Venom dipeptidyl peptidase 4 n=1 Tax=Culicoides sonorensis TaxID=179676 RepID=A0A336M465_CULSO